MIDRDTFQAKLKLLSGRFPNFDLRAEVVTEYYRILSQRLTTEQFVAAVERVFVESEFFPSPQAFLDAAGGNLEARAASEWIAAIQPSSWDGNGRETWNKYEFSDRGRFAWNAIGERRISNATDDQIDFLRREFVRWYTTADEETLAMQPRLERGQRHARLTSGQAIAAIQAQAENPDHTGHPPPDVLEKLEMLAHPGRTADDIRERLLKIEAYEAEGMKNPPKIELPKDFVVGGKAKPKEQAS